MRGHGLAHLLHLGNVADRIHLLHVPWINPLEPFAGVPHTSAAKAEGLLFIDDLPGHSKQIAGRAGNTFFCDRQLGLGKKFGSCYTRIGLTKGSL
jgi:hypothetical protein